MVTASGCESLGPQPAERCLLGDAAVLRPVWPAAGETYRLIDARSGLFDEEWRSHRSARDVMVLAGEVRIGYLADGQAREAVIGAGSRATVAAGVEHRIRGRGLFELLADGPGPESEVGQ